MKRKGSGPGLIPFVFLRYQSIMNTLSSHQLPLEVTAEQVAARLGLRFRPAIGRSLVCGDMNRRVFWTRFNVLVFWGYDAIEVGEVLGAFSSGQGQDWPCQDYPLLVRADLAGACRVSNDAIVLRELNASMLDIAALALSQSVGLERHELALEQRLPQVRRMMDRIGHFNFFHRKRLLAVIADLARQRHEIIGDLYLLDKPDITWENETLEGMYNSLARQLELRDRFQVLEYKLRLIKDEVDVILDFVNQKTSEFLEWIIIALIAIEIFFWFYEQFTRY